MLKLPGAFRQLQCEDHGSGSCRETGLGEEGRCGKKTNQEADAEVQMSEDGGLDWGGGRDGGEAGTGFKSMEEKNTQQDF